jgi:hypothetical protein
MRGDILKGPGGLEVASAFLSLRSDRDFVQRPARDHALERFSLIGWNRPIREKRSRFKNLEYFPIR